MTAAVGEARKREREGEGGGAGGGVGGGGEAETKYGGGHSRSSLRLAGVHFLRQQVFILFPPLNVQPLTTCERHRGECVEVVICVCVDAQAGAHISVLDETRDNLLGRRVARAPTDGTDNMTLQRASS